MVERAKTGRWRQRRCGAPAALRRQRGHSGGGTRGKQKGHVSLSGLGELFAVVPLPPFPLPSAPRRSPESDATVESVGASGTPELFRSAQNGGTAERRSAGTVGERSGAERSAATSGPSRMVSPARRVPRALRPARRPPRPRSSQLGSFRHRDETPGEGSGG